MRFSRLIYMTVKQYLLSPAFLLLLILLPCVCLFAGLPQKEHDDRIRIGYCFCDTGLQDPLADSELSEDLQWLADALQNTNSLFSFYRSPSPDDLRADVAGGSAECGYLIPADLFEKLRKDKKKELIALLTSPHTTMSAVVNERFYAILYPRLSCRKFTEYLISDSAVSRYYPGMFSETDAENLYRKYLTNGSTFSFEYKNSVSAFHYGTRTVLSSPLRGLFAVFILLAGFTGTLSYYQAAEHPLYANWRVRVVRILVPLFFAMLSSWGCLFLLPDIPGLTHTLPGFFLEGLRLLLYTAACLLFLLLLSTLVKSRGLMYAVFPLYLMGCLIFSPIFIDAGRYLPFLRTVARIFLPTWYLL
ncbi:MAG: hypothetical protein IJ600_05280 [Lachnospiraceae bacterium]|nr:hypothetical protein [Lachnospiraceae bacterium]